MPDPEIRIIFSASTFIFIGLGLVGIGIISALMWASISYVETDATKGYIGVGVTSCVCLIYLIVGIRVTKILCKVQIIRDPPQVI